MFSKGTSGSKYRVDGIGVVERILEQSYILEGSSSKRYEKVGRGCSTKC